MFDDFAIKTELAFEEKFDALATAKKVIQALRFHARINYREDSTSMIDSITGLQGLLQTLANYKEDVNALYTIILLMTLPGMSYN